MKQIEYNMVRQKSERKNYHMRYTKNKKKIETKKKDREFYFI